MYTHTKCAHTHTYTHTGLAIDYDSLKPELSKDPAPPAVTMVTGVEERNLILIKYFKTFPT